MSVSEYSDVLDFGEDEKDVKVGNDRKLLTTSQDMPQQR